MSEFIAEAQVLVVPNTDEFALALRKQLETAVLKAGPLTVPVVAATGASSASTQVAGALSTQKRATEEAAAATRALAKHEKEAIAIRSQATKGILAETLAVTGLRGATLAASKPFIIGAAATILFTKGIREASNEVEQLNKSREVFGQFSKEVEDFAATSAKSFGESRASALELVSTFGALLRPIGFTQRAAADTSLRLTKLGADLASFFNTDVSDALAAIQSGLVGQVRPLRRYGVELSAARVNALALAETGKKVASSLTDQEKVAARIQVIFKDTAIAQGDFARTSGQFANQTRILTAELADLEGALGRIAIPGLTLVLRTMTTGIDVATRYAHAVGLIAGAFKDAGDAAIRFQKIPLPKVPEDTGRGVRGGLFGLAGNITQIEQQVVGFSRLFIQSTGAVQTESEKTAAAVKKIRDETAATGGSIAHFDGQMNQLIEDLRKTGPEGQATADKLQLLKDAIDVSGVLPGPKKLADLMKQLGITVDTTDASVRRATSGLQGLKNVLDEASGAASTLEGHMASLATRTSAAAFAGPGAELSQAKANQAEGLKHLRTLLGLDPGASRAEIQAAIDARRFSKGREKAVNQALDEVTAADRVISNAATTAANNKKQAAADQKRAAQDAATAQKEATQALIDTFAPKNQRLQNRLTTAQTFGTVKQQIAAQKAILAEDNAEIRAIKAFIRQKHLHGDALKAARAEIARLVQEEFNTRNAIRQLQEGRKQAIVDARQSHLEAQLAIAETTKSTADDRAAEKALIAFDKAQIARLKRLKKQRGLTLEEAAQLDAYRVDLAQRNEALRNLQKEQNKGNQTANEFFNFLQTQAGFAANLLGNLIPGGATGGLVGGVAQSQAAMDATLRQVSGGFEQPRGAVSATSAAAASRDRGVRPIQVDTTNALLRQIVRLLQHQLGRTGHPEARFQDHQMRAAFDGVHGN